MRKSVSLLLIAVLALSAVSAPAFAGKKKKKKKAQLAVFEADGTILTGNLVSISGLGITANEFETSGCSMPATQGLDAYVIELPDAYVTAGGSAYASGNDSAGLLDLDLYFYSDGCAEIGALSTSDTAEFGALPVGTRYVVVGAWMGLQANFTLKIDPNWVAPAV